jgi:ferric-dicitrate binding protein FerR (iron transport regulator)
MKDNSHINNIVVKAITDEELTQAERITLDVWLTEEANRALFENLKNKDYLLQKLIEAHNVDVEGDKVLLDQKMAKVQSIIKRKAWYRDVATAAAVIVLLTAAALFWFNTRKTGNHEMAKVNIPVTQKEIVPGQTKASLTLADGKKLVLDSTANGQLAQQGGMIVVNENSTLIYKENGQSSNAALFNILSTGNGQTYGMVLADGSKVWLNAGASIRYPVAFTGNERKVEVTGEAYFEVAHQADKPFVVHVSNQKGGEMDVQVLGTRFNINAYIDEVDMKTTLLEGSVKISVGNSQTLLEPGHQAQVSHGMATVFPHADLDSAIAWKNGKFNFENADINGVMRQLTKWYDISVVYEGPKPTRKFKGEMERNLTLPQVLNALKLTTPGIQFRVEGRKLIVLSPRH